MTQTGLTAKAGILYFVIVFAGGFVFGTIRVAWLVPQLGERNAELLEMPLMLIVTLLAARWVIHHLSLPSSPRLLLRVGLFALALLMGAEFTFVLGLRGLTFSEYLAGRDPVSGTAYLVMLGFFTLMPCLLGLRPRTKARE